MTQTTDLQAPVPASPARRPGPAPSLSKGEIADTAIALIEREGPAALSIRRLAEELGIGAMTFYGYFRDKAELLDFAVDRAARELSLSPGEGPWRSRLRELIEEIWRSLNDHPGIVLIRARRPFLTETALRACESGMQILTEAGFETEEAAGAWRLLFTYVFGYAAFSSPEATEELRREWSEQMGALPADRFPMIVAAAPDLPGWMTGRKAFEFGLELILDGLEARLSGKLRDDSP
jgi:AcrR family transcriptional regulator